MVPSFPCAVWFALWNVTVSQRYVNVSQVESTTSPPRVSHVLDEGAELGQDLAFAGVVEEDARRRDGVGREQGLQPSVGDRRGDERAGHLRETQTPDRRADQRGVVVGDERARDDRLHRLVAVDEGPGRDRAVRATEAQARVVAQIVDARGPLPPA